MYRPVEKKKMLAKAERKRQINVYGVTSGENPTLKRLSPTVEPLKHNIPITQFASLAGAVNEDFTQGWLYYLAYVPIFFYSCRGSRSTCSHVTQD
jgi:hypothetical protein